MVTGTPNFLDFAEVADRFHLPAIQSQDERALDGDDLEQPFVVGRQIERKRKRRTQRFGRDADEVGDIRAGGLASERIFAREIDDLFRAARS